LSAGAAILGTGSAAAAVNASVVPGRSWFLRRIGLNGTAGAPPSVAAGPRIDGSFVSAARRGTDCGWSVGYPPGTDPDGRPALPVVLVLHGRGADHRAAFDDGYLALGRYQAAAVEAGAAPFVVASIDGGDTYWHPRSNGEDAAAMLTDEFLPLLADRGLDVSRIGLLGWSMGGYGALRLAGRLGPKRVAAVAAESPALWHHYPDSAPGAFDDAKDFAAQSVFGRQDDLAGIAVRIDCGQSDPFYSAIRDYRDGFAVRPKGGFQLGRHDTGYWRRMAPAQLPFLSRSLPRS
jgi:dienelactone hydrolase